jgi:RNA polymerase II subunit A C-terminal domain phosphatase SSU72
MEASGDKSPTSTVTNMDISFALVCASNQNRSMATHSAFSASAILRTYFVKSYGTGSQVKLPGKTQAEPNTYPFGTPYMEMYNDLRKKDEKFYIQNGLLPMLKRNSQIKLAPERWHQKDRPFHNIIFSFEDRVFDAIVDSLIGRYGMLQERPESAHRAAHVLNLNVKDNHEEAVKNAKLVADFCEEIANCETEGMRDWESELDTILRKYEKTFKKRIYHLVLFES